MEFSEKSVQHIWHHLSAVEFFTRLVSVVVRQIVGCLLLYDAMILS